MDPALIAHPLSPIGARVPRYAFLHATNTAAISIADGATDMSEMLIPHPNVVRDEAKN